MHRLQVVHEDVQIRLFWFSLEGISLHWCQSLPRASVSSLAEFHAAFHLFCETKFSTDLLYPECCHEFILLYKDLDNHEEHVEAEDISHHDKEINDSHYDNLSYAFDIISNTSTVVSCHEDQIFISENFEDDEQTNKTTADSFRSAEVDEGSLQSPDLQGLSGLQLEHENHDQEWVDAVVDTSHESLDPNNREDPNLGVEFAAYVMSSPYFPDLQTKADCSTFEESDSGEISSSPDQQSIGNVSPADLEQFTHIIEINEDSQPHHFRLQSEQKLEEVFHYFFIDPIAAFLESLSSIKIRIFLSDERCFCHFSRTYLCWLRILLFLGSRSRILSTNKFLTWLCWKCAFT